MDHLHAVYLALLQGLTEFLPISSSAHLVLLPKIFGWEDQGLAFDVAVHVGTLFAVIAYFRHDIFRLLAAWLRSLEHRQMTSDAKLVWFVLLGSVPLAMVGLIFHDYIEMYLRAPLIIAATTIGFGLSCWVLPTCVVKSCAVKTRLIISILSGSGLRRCWR